MTCVVNLLVSFKTVVKLRRLVSLPTMIQFAVIAKLRRLVSESTTIQFNSFGWDSVADGHTCHVLLTGLVADAGKLRRLSCSQDDFIYFLPVAATSLRAGFQVYLSKFQVPSLPKLWVVDVTKAVRYDLLIYCLLSDIILYFLLLAATSLRARFQVYLS